MSVFEIILISVGLAMDAFGVSIGKGLSMPVGENGRKVTLAFLFGLFQFLMPVIGWLIGRQFIDVIFAGCDGMHHLTDNDQRRIAGVVVHIF